MNNEFNEETGMVEKPEETYVIVELDRKSLDVVHRSLRYVAEHQEVVDWTILGRIDLEDIKNMADRFENLPEPEEGDTAKVPMTKSEWIDYDYLVDYVGTVIPREWMDERRLLEVLSYKYFDLDEALEAKIQ